MIHRLILSVLFLSYIYACSSEKEDQSSSQEDKHQKKETNAKPQPLKMDTSGVHINKFENLHKKYNLNNEDRSLAAYLRSNMNQPDGKRQIIYLMPLGNMRPEVEAFLTDQLVYFEAFFQREVELLPRVPLDDIKRIENVKTRKISEESDYQFGKKARIQYNIIEQLEVNSLGEQFIKPNKPEDAVAVLGITDHDLYAPDYNYLFGSSKIKGGVGVISTHRLVNESYYGQENLKKLITKQIVNLLSIRNVKDYECLMNFSTDMEDLSNKPVYLSPVALQKLKMNLGFDYTKRFQDLMIYWRENQNYPHHKYYNNCLGLIDSTLMQPYPQR